MSPLSLGLPLIAPAVQRATRVAAGGFDFLQSLFATNDRAAQAASPPAKSGASAIGQYVDPAVTNLQQAIASLVQRAGFAEALPLAVSDDGFGGMRVDSASSNRMKIEQLLNDQASIAQHFRALASRAGQSMAKSFSLIVPSSAGLDMSA